MYINKYDLFSPYNITCIYNSIADQLVLDTQLGCSSLKKMISPLSVVISFLSPFFWGGPCEILFPC